MDVRKTDKRITTVETLFIVAVLIYALWSMVRIIVSVAPDFMVYYLGVIPQNGTQHIVTNLLPPASRLVYWPIVLLPYQWSQALWVFVSIFVFGYPFDIHSICLEIMLVEMPYYIWLLHFFRSPRVLPWGWGK